MKFDISFVSTCPPDQIVKFSLIAEKMGFNAVWMAHDMLWDNAWVLCGAIANSTSKILVGPGIINPFSCSLPEIAMAATSLDNLSNGRCVLGIGPGAKGMLHDAGIDQNNVISRLNESVQYLKNSLNPASNIMNIDVTHEIPIYIGCQSPKMLEHVGRWGVGTLLLLSPPKYASKALGFIKKGAKLSNSSLQHDNLVASVFISLSRKNEEAEKRFGDFIISVLPHLSSYQLIESNLSDSEIISIIDVYNQKGWSSLPSKIFELGAIGVESCIKTFESLTKVGFNRFKFGSPLGPDIEESLSIFHDEILPIFTD